MIIHPLGQAGYKIECQGIIFYIDPYLSNSVQEKECPACERLIPIPIEPDQVIDADYVLVTHVHRDHCDEETLVPISMASPNCIFVGPLPVCEKLKQIGIEKNRIILATVEKIQVVDELNIFVIPAAHPEVEKNTCGGWNAIGFVIQSESDYLYLAGDTCLTDTVLRALDSYENIKTAILPVNEKNYQRDKMNIIGNMSVRDAFYMAESLKVEILIPSHWDMFTDNQVYIEEIELLYNKIKPKFDLIINKEIIYL